MYCGQDEWVHVNCALWSSEVDESHTGDASLHHVFAAIYRGRSMRCGFCQEHGATVGCAAEHCSVQYHFTCARQTNCVFCTNGNTFCLQHKAHAIGLNVVKDFRLFSEISLLSLERHDDEMTIGIAESVRWQICLFDIEVMYNLNLLKQIYFKKHQNFKNVLSIIN